MTGIRSRQGASPAELGAWLSLLVAAVALRVYDLGARVMSHDESIHSFYAYELLRQGTYTHDPTYHGPLLYHLNALIFFFLGASDATARLGAALAGTALVASVWLFRPYLGRAGAFGAATLVALSPALLFYSRQVWMDIHVALFSMFWIYGVFRYLAERTRRWIFLVAAAMLLAFAAKEVAFIFGAIMGIWLLVELVASRRSDPARAMAAGDLMVFMLGLVLPFSSGAAYLALGWNVRDTNARGLLVVLGLAALGGVIVWGWIRMRGRLLAPGAAPTQHGMRLRDWVWSMALFWGISILLFTAFFTNLRNGLSTGIVGSLGYWLTQHEVARGSQPWFYYLLLAVLYEILPLIAGSIAIVAAAAALRRASWDPATGDLGPDATASAQEAADARATTASVGRSDRRSFFSFLLWWVIATWGAYTWAGEKMPWLVTHLMLPLAIFAGWGIARLILGARAGSKAGALVLVAGGAVVPVVAFEWLLGSAFAGATTTAVADTMEWMVRALVLVVLVAFMARAAWRAGVRQAARWVALGVAVLLFALTVRAGIRLCYINYDLATEHLSYAQGSPDVKRAMREIELISERSAGDRELFVAYDDQSSWPFVWYLRDYPKSRTWGTQAQFAQGAAVIITGHKNRDAAWTLVADGYVKREYRLIWWPVQEYSGMGPGDLVKVLRDPVRRHQLWRMAMYHDYSHKDFVKWDPRQDFEMYVRDDVAPLGLAALGLGDTAGGGGGSTTAGSSSPASTGTGTRLEPQPKAIYTGPFADLALEAPTEVAIGPDGARVIADAGNHRIVVLERDGTLRLAFGGKCDLGQAATSGCLDPDGSGPLELGDGQFNEPWGVAVGASGQIFVSDTWNHRVERFDASGRFAGKWGRYGNVSAAGTPPVEEPIFYGPRGISDGFDDELVVADTGNKRLLVFSPDGGLLRTIGSGGAGADQWNEPVGIAPDQNGTLLVADTWNRRVKRLDRRYASIANWRVPDWRSESVSDKPFIVADDEGMVYASDPTGGRVWIFAPSGRLEGTLILPALTAGKPRPLGLAVDGAAGELLVVDQTGERVLVYALPTLRTAQAPS